MMAEWWMTLWMMDDSSPGRGQDVDDGYQMIDDGGCYPGLLDISGYCLDVA